MNKFIIATALASAAVALPAQAAVLWTGASAPQLASPDSFGFNVGSGATTGKLTFTIDGYGSLDGVNYYEDDFTLSLNGIAILQLSYNLGGGGDNAIFTNTAGATVSNPYSVNGHNSIDISFASLPLTVGNNSFLFSYASASGDALGGAGAHAGAQGLGDEGWGVSNIKLTGQVLAVPEPASWALMLGGFAIVGAAMRWRRRSASIA